MNGRRESIDAGLADLERICYARGTGAERTVVTVYYTDDWRAAYFDHENY